MKNTVTISNLDVVYNMIETMHTDSPTAILSAFLCMTFGMDPESITRAEIGMTSEVEGVQIIMEDGSRLVVINETSSDAVNDAIAPQSVVFEGKKFVAFVETPEEGASFFLGDIPQIVEGTLFAGTLVEVVSHIRNHFSGDE